ncbi:MAG: ATP-binding cassette domain-containing protein [Clostridia bacterium]|nr:ATP-binding cassette domain-containing protein [Clostridia bacterium]
MEKVLEVNGLTKLFKNGRGIRDISFDVYQGEIFGFLGPNGAGKTTTMKIITGLSRADRGSVKIFGYDVLTRFEEAMRKVGCIIETVESYEFLSAAKNLEMALRYYPGLDKSRIHEVLELVGLDKYKNEKVGCFSLGMKQRLGLASAILSKPELVILDEPANGLDIEGTVDIRNIITRLAREQGITFFISSHMIHEMEITCDRIGIIEDGRIIRTGIVRELLDQYSSLEDYFITQVREDRGRIA